jgi:hypothetical protein
MADEERGALERRLRDETHRRTLKILSTGVHVTKVGSPLPHRHQDRPDPWRRLHTVQRTWAQPGPRALHCCTVL